MKNTLNLAILFSDSNAVFGLRIPYYYHSDHLGSSEIMTDREGDLVQHYGYYPFGNEHYSENSSAFSVSNRYTGQILDEDTGLYYFGARYYDPELARFVHPDSIFPDDPTGNSQALNRYTYVYNNPLKFTDPTGNKPKHQHKQDKEIEQQKDADSTTPKSVGTTDKQNDIGGAATTSNSSTKEQGTQKADRGRTDVAFYDNNVSQITLGNRAIRADSKTLKRFAKKFSEHVYPVDSAEEMYEKVDELKKEGHNIGNVYLFIHGQPGSVEFIEGAEITGKPITDAEWQKIGSILPAGSTINLMACNYAAQGRDGSMNIDGMKSLAGLTNLTQHTVTAYNASLRPYGFSFSHGGLYEARRVVNKEGQQTGVNVWSKGPVRPDRLGTEWRVHRKFSVKENRLNEIPLQ